MDQTVLTYKDDHIITTIQGASIRKVFIIADIGNIDSFFSTHCTWCHPHLIRNSVVEEPCEILEHNKSCYTSHAVTLITGLSRNYM